MSIATMGYVWEHSKQKSSRRLMLLAIADIANDSGDAFPGVARLARKCNMSERNAQNIIEELERSGELLVFENVGTQTASGWTNLYRIVMPGVAQSVIFNRDGEKVLPRRPKAGKSRTFAEGVKPVAPLESGEETEGVKPVAPHGVKPVAPHGVKPVAPEQSGEQSGEQKDFAPDGALLPEQENPDVVSEEQPRAEKPDMVTPPQDDRSPSDAQSAADLPTVFADAIEDIPDDSFYDDDWDDAPRKLYECTSKDIAAMLAMYYEWVPVKPLNARRRVMTLKEVLSNTSNRDCAKALWERGVRLTDVVACLGKMRRTPPPGGHEPMTFCFVAIKIEEWARKDRADNWYSEKFVSICPKRPGVRIEDWNSLAEFKAAYPDGHPDYYVEVPPPYINPDAPDEDDWDDYDDESTLTADEIAAIYADAAGG